MHLWCQRSRQPRIDAGDQCTAHLHFICNQRVSTQNFASAKGFIVELRLVAGSGELAWVVGRQPSCTKLMEGG